MKKGQQDRIAETLTREEKTFLYLFTENTCQTDGYHP